MRINHAIPVLVCTSQMMWLFWIFIYSSAMSLVRLIFNASGVLDWMSALTFKSVPVDHAAILFNLALILKKNPTSIAFIVIAYACLVVAVGIVEALLYPYALDTARNTLPDFGRFFWRNWRKITLFLIMFTPIWILSGLLGYLATIITQGTSLSSIPVELIRFAFMSIPLIILIPSRFYFLEGHGFLKSIIESLFNIRVYFRSTILILIPSGCIYVVLIRLAQSSMTNLQLLLSFSPWLYALGALFWPTWSVSVFTTARAFQAINSNKGDY